MIEKKNIILRHKKENFKKCSLKGLENRDDFIFYKYPRERLPDLSNYILLTLEAPELTINDKVFGICVIDATWRYEKKMYSWLTSQISIQKRSLPSYYKTAYPRYQTDCCDPERGLASIEAIFLAYLIMEKPIENLLDNYYWKEKFYKINNIKIS